uniref:Protein phosphatase 1 regulatory subunit 12A-like n=1 Tax=Saccoglossus kowalevskii TaxID=10224 RepID=A0ABM0MSE8_SACKO
MLEEEIDKQGIDVEEARNGEEHKMLADANQWLNSKVVKEKKHDKSGATALHVAAAKGYIKVMNLLIQAGVSINAQDNDGWSPLHAAAHWGQKEASEVLVENMADFAHKNSLGGTCFDVADEDMLKWLEELKKKQASIQKDDKPAAPRIARAPPPLKRRSSVSRINVNKKELLMHQDMSSERKRLEEKIHGK